MQTTTKNKISCAKELPQDISQQETKPLVFGFCCC
jgi:hypothetical protein